MTGVEMWGCVWSLNIC